MIVLNNLALIKEQYSIIELEKIINNLHLMNKKGKYINKNEKEINNYIMVDYYIKEDNENSRIINLYEETD